MVTISQVLAEKIERRSRRAFRRHDESDGRRIHRITGVTDSSLKYRLSRRRNEHVEVVREGQGIVVDPPTTGLIDVLKNSDIKKLKNATGKPHEGEVCAYLLLEKGKKRKTIGKNYKPKTPVTLMSREQCVDEIKVGERVYVVELKGEKIVDISTLGLTAKTFTVTDELEAEKDLGFTTGLFDCRSKADVIKLRKKKHLGRVRAYKYTDKDGKSPINSTKLTYEVGKVYEIKDADTNPGSNCHKGVNVADVEWAKRGATGDKRLFAFEFEMEDIAAIPTNTDGKFRVHRCTCVDELNPKNLKPLKKPKPPKDGEKKPKKKKKKKGFMDKLLGRGDDE